MNGPARYRKKPVVIEAFQWDGSAAGATPIIQWVLAAGGTARYGHANTGIAARPEGAPLPEPVYAIRIDTLEGTMSALEGDWIIRGVQGEFYPCKPDIFEATYEPADG